MVSIVVLYIFYKITSLFLLSIEEPDLPLKAASQSIVFQYFRLVSRPDIIAA